MLNPNVALNHLVNQNKIKALLSLIARVLMAYIFTIAGWGKIAGYEATIGYMEAMGVPSAMLPLTILLELGGGLALLLGFQTRLVALGLAVFSLITAFIFHSGVDDAVNFMKNMAIAGGLLLLVLQGAGKLSIDQVIEK